jgi:capsular polysaccharide biosynthesis protein
MDKEKMSNVSLVEPAYPPAKPIGPKRSLNVALAIVFGTFGGVGLAFLRHYLSDRLETPEEVERALKLSILTSIPERAK